jgi:serine/threonine protein kinase
VAGNVKLIDFGIANALQQDKTSITREMQIGTLNYMSPESISQAECGHVFDSDGNLKPKFKVSIQGFQLPSSGVAQIPGAQNTTKKFLAVIFCTSECSNLLPNTLKGLVTSILLVSAWREE